MCGKKIKKKNHLRFSTYHIWECMCDHFQKERILTFISGCGILELSHAISPMLTGSIPWFTSPGFWVLQRQSIWSINCVAILCALPTPPSTFMKSARELSYPVSNCKSQTLSFQVSKLESRYKSHKDQIEDLSFLFKHHIGPPDCVDCRA